MEQLQQLISIWPFLVIVASGGALALMVRITNTRVVKHDVEIAELKASDGAHREKLATELATLKTTQEAQTKTLQRMESKVDRILEDGCYRANEFHKDGAR